MQFFLWLSVVDDDDVLSFLESSFMYPVIFLNMGFLCHLSG